jgi:hypothetical protein
LKNKNLEILILHFSGHSDKGSGSWIFDLKGEKNDVLGLEEIIQEWDLRENR